MTTHTCVVCGSPADNLVYGGYINTASGWVINRVWMCNPCAATDQHELEELRRG